MEVTALKFEAELRQIKSMADRTYNIVINVPEYHVKEVKEMVGHEQELIQVAVVIDKNRPD